MNTKKMRIIVAMLLSLGVSHVAWADSAALKEISLLSEQGNQSAALDKVNTYLKSNPQDAEALFMKGVILVELGKRDDAISAFTDLTSKYPNLPEPYNNLAVLYADKGEYDKARRALETAIKTHPSYATAHENLGDIYARLASDSYNKAFKLDSTNARAQNKLSMITNLFGGKVVASNVASQPSNNTVVATKDTPKVVATKEPEVAKTTKATESAKPETQAKQEMSANQDDAVMAAVNDWAKAWSNKDVNAYLASYGSDFKSLGGRSRQGWESYRRERLNAPKTISVNVGSPKVTMVNADTAKVSFYQTYEADGKPQSTSKTLVLKKTNNQWLIQQENVGR
jgi:tetratricopeptide (TPR) repeat protein